MEKGNTKQEILDVALTLFSTQEFEATSVSEIANAVGILFVLADWDVSAFMKDKQNLLHNVMLQIILGQIRYLLHDPQTSKSRKMLTIEQFQNSKLIERHIRQFFKLYGTEAKTDAV